MVQKWLWGRREKSGHVARRLEGVYGAWGPERELGDPILWKRGVQSILERCEGVYTVKKCFWGRREKSGGIARRLEDV